MPEKQIKTGLVKQVIGAVVDVQFSGALPEVYTALEIDNHGKKLVLETQQHLGAGMVRAVAMGSTDGLKRGDKVVNTGGNITVPVGDATLGRIFNVLGEPVDGLPAAKTAKRYPIHRPAPKFVEQSIKTEILETGIKVIDLICPILKGCKVGLFG
ncbi:F0F1 ATP synthase subunit beta, partial [Candidatus Falkowbacteria bacterium]|nr:F0F1 ATP synthase subunit beta [Candidatus Falkowbacteria bacterium]